MKLKIYTYLISSGNELNSSSKTNTAENWENELVNKNNEGKAKKRNTSELQNRTSNMLLVLYPMASILITWRKYVVLLTQTQNLWQHRWKLNNFPVLGFSREIEPVREAYI